MNAQKGQMTATLMRFVKIHQSRTNAFVNQVIKAKENNVKVRVSSSRFSPTPLPNFIYSANAFVNSGIPDMINVGLWCLLGEKKSPAAIANCLQKCHLLCFVSYFWKTKHDFKTERGFCVKKQHALDCVAASLSYPGLHWEPGAEGGVNWTSQE